MFLKRNYKNLSAVFPVAIFIVISLIMLLNATNSFLNNNAVATPQREVDLIRKYAVQCYATEGSYPKDLAYLEKNYHLILKRDKYEYFYEVFASNVAPTIHVIKKLSLIDDFNKGKE